MKVSSNITVTLGGETVKMWVLVNANANALAIVQRKVFAERKAKEKRKITLSKQKSEAFGSV